MAISEFTYMKYFSFPNKPDIRVGECQERNSFTLGGYKLNFKCFSIAI